MGLAVAAVDVFGVQQLMRQMAVRLAQELRVELLDIRVFVGLADRLGFILGIQPRCARRARRVSAASPALAAAPAGSRGSTNSDTYDASTAPPSTA